MKDHPDERPLLLLPSILSTTKQSGHHFFVVETWPFYFHINEALIRNHLSFKNTSGWFQVGLKRGVQFYHNDLPLDMMVPRYILSSPTSVQKRYFFSHRKSRAMVLRSPDTSDTVLMSFKSSCRISWRREKITIVALGAGTVRTYIYIYIYIYTHTHTHKVGPLDVAINTHTKHTHTHTHTIQTQNKTNKCFVFKQ